MNLLILYFQKNKFIVGLFLIICCGCQNHTPTTSIDNMTHIKQGIKGKIVFKEGSFSSEGNLEGNGKIYAAERTVYIYELTSIAEIEMGDGDFIRYISKLPLDTVRSDEHGIFQVELPVGKYSIVIEENNRLYSKLSTEDYLLPVTVEENSISDLIVEIDYKVVY